MPPAATSGPPNTLDLHAALRILQVVDPSSALFGRSREILRGSLEVESPVPKATGPKQPKFLTIGMVTRDDYDGFYFSIQAIRLYHPEILHDVEFLAVDNNPAGPCGKPQKNLEHLCPNYRYVPYRSSQGSEVRDLIFREAKGDFVLCMDSHVLFPPGSLARLIEYCRGHPDSPDLLQGPLLSEALKPMATHLEPSWSRGRYGCWGMDRRGQDSDAPPFEIGMQALGLFACRRQAWPGFNPRLAGSSGEEGYIHEKIRRAGGRTLCLPFLRWTHRSARPMGTPHSSNPADRLRNYLLMHHELGLDPTPAIRHFEKFLGLETAGPLVAAAQAEFAGPFHAFDAIYCINLDRQPERWQAMERRFRELGIDRRVRRFSAADTPLNHHIGRALSHRRIVAEAKQLQLETVLVFEDNAFEDDPRFSPALTSEIQLGVEELAGCDWHLWYVDRSVVAYHHTVYDAILNALPDDAVHAARLVRSLEEPHATLQQLFLQFDLRSAPQEAYQCV